MLNGFSALFPLMCIEPTSVGEFIERLFLGEGDLFSRLERGSSLADALAVHKHRRLMIIALWMEQSRCSLA